ncbi:SRPBCC family protein [Halioxenophilus sp. WMMB6]|uniref:SRPBCC family protein n=1 Tax=Halioxenophilus sp. WMMB6 TaxID=3073815 RepID=UPI00295E3EDB|nr:SRPBCC family protein [Halioxenophilus sp. WMMB6]
MYSTQVTRDFDFSADTVWNLLIDWGNTAWLPGPEKTEVITNDGQITRKLFIAAAEPIEETMTSNDPTSKTLHYTIAVGQLFTLENYQGQVRIIADGGKSKVEWSCSFDQGGMSVDEAETRAVGNMNFLMDNMIKYLAG